MESKKKLWRGFAIFMAVMLVMTFVSRIVYVNQAAAGSLGESYGGFDYQ